MKNYVDSAGLQEYTNKLIPKLKTIFPGAPLAAATAAAMTDHAKVYVYTGSETGYTAGNWYYWDGTAWASGGVYNSTALTTDTTLSVAGMAADAKVTGDVISDLKGDVENITGAIGIHTWSDYTAKKYINLSGSSVTIEDGHITESTGSNNVMYLVAQAAENDRFTITAKGGSSSRAYGFVSSTGEILEVADASQTISNTVKTAPANTAYLVVNDTLGTGTVYAGDAVTPLEERISKSFLFDVLDSSVKSITASDNLNNFLTIGNYKKTITNGSPANCPVGNNITFSLKVMQIAASSTYCQILIPAAPSVGYLWFRLIGTSGGTPSFGDWHQIADDRDIDTLTKSSIVHKPTIITKDNVTTYFPNSSFNDAKPNTIYGIAEYLDMDEAPVISDAPPGDQVYGVPVDQSQTPSSPVKQTGGIRGTLMTYSQAFGENDASGLVQIFVAYPGYKNYYGVTSPSISFRIAYYEDDIYHWSDWSKLSQDGVVHSGNGIVYGGEPYISDAPFTDLNDAPPNGIFHADRNMDGSDEAHTLLHHPIPGQSCMIVTFAFSPGFNHARTQIVYALNGRMFWRYEYLNNGENWTDWYEVPNLPSGYEIMYNKGRLANGANLNSVFDNAVYLLGGQSGAQYVNNPITGAGFLTAKKTNAVCLQTVEALSGTVYRRYSDDSGTTWSNWA